MDKTQLKKDLLISLMNMDNVSKKDMGTFIVKIVEAINKLKAELIKEVQDTVGYTKNTSQSLENALQSLETRLIGLISKSTKESQDKAYKELNNAVYNLEKTLAELPHFDPETLEKKWGVVVAEMDKAMKEMCSGKKIKEKLEALDDGEKLSIEAIKNLRKELDDLKKFVRSSNTSINGSVVGRDVVKEIDISSQLDGSTKTFNIPSTYRILSVDLSSFPYGSCRKNIDYTYTSTTITFTSQIDAPTQLATGQSCIITTITN